MLLKISISNKCSFELFCSLKNQKKKKSQLPKKNFLSTKSAF